MEASLWPPAAELRPAHQASATSSTCVLLPPHRASSPTPSTCSAFATSPWSSCLAPTRSRRSARCHGLHRLLRAASQQCALSRIGADGSSSWRPRRHGVDVVEEAVNGGVTNIASRACSSLGRRHRRWRCGAVMPGLQTTLMEELTTSIARSAGSSMWPARMASRWLITWTIFSGTVSSTAGWSRPFPPPHTWIGLNGWIIMYVWLDWIGLDDEYYLLGLDWMLT